MKLKWRKRKPATFAARQPKTMTVSVEEVMDLVALVGVLYSEPNRPQPEDPALRDLVQRCVEARKQVHNGYKVTVAVEHGELSSMQ